MNKFTKIDSSKLRHRVAGRIFDAKDYPGKDLRLLAEAYAEGHPVVVNARERPARVECEVPGKHGLWMPVG